MNIDVALISVGCALIGAIIGYFTFLTNEKKLSKNDGSKEGVIASDLGYVKKGIEDINHKLEKQDERYYELAQRVSVVETSTKQAHKRINELMKCEEESE